MRMKTLALAMCIIFAAVFPLAPVVQAQDVARTPADEAAIRALIGRYVSARDARDPKLIEPLFTSDADQYTTAGEWRRGRVQVVPGTLESSARDPGKRSIDIASLRFVTADVAIIDGAYNVEGSPLKRWTTIVVKRDSGAWRISAIRNMVPTTQQPAPR